MPLTVQFWGTRGSIPSPGPSTVRYGGNTPCVELRTEDGWLVILDAGTGIRDLGRSLMDRANGAPIAGDIFLTHAHWDHIQGIPFFRPLYDSANNVFVFHSSRRNRSLKQVMEEQMAAPYFPVNMNDMQANRAFHDIEEGRVALDESVTVQAAWLNHPQ